MPFAVNHVDIPLGQLPLGAVGTPAVTGHAFTQEFPLIVYPALQEVSLYLVAVEQLEET